MPLHRFVLALFLIASTTLGALAQTGEGDGAQRVESLQRSVDAVAAELAEAGDSDARLAELGDMLASLQDELLAAGVELTAELGEVKARLNQIGPPPADSEAAEPTAATEQRADLSAQRARINQLIGALEEQSIAARRLSDRIVERRRALFTQTLARRYDITTAFGSQLVADIADRTQALQRRIQSWAAFTWRTKQSRVLIGALGVMALSLAAVMVFRRTIGIWVARRRSDEPPSDFVRLTNAFWYTVLPTAVLWAYLAAALVMLDRLSLLRPDILAIATQLALGIGVVFLIWRLAEAVFAPSVPHWRLIPVTDRAARLLKGFFVVMAAVTVTELIVERVNELLGASLPITIARSLLASVLTGLLLVLIAFLRPFAAEGDARPAPWPGYVKWPLLAVGGALIVMALAGYIGFARFAAEQIVVTGAVLTTLYLGHLAAAAIAKPSALAETGLGRRLAERHGATETTIDQLGLAAGIGLRVIVLAIGLPVLALMWGYRWSDVRAVIYRIFTDIPVGSISISITSIAVGIALFIAGYWLTRRFQSWLDASVLERSRVEPGARTSIRKAMGYTGIAIAALIGLSAAGFNLSQLALVAGALSLGIGFGLQNIVNNFVSGLILLAERPFKSGDIIEAGGFVGVVSNVNVRATEIQLFDRKTLILPNSELINQPVSNWMHRNTLGRVAIPIGVAYGSDARRVHDLLLEIAAEHDDILSFPEPFVSFDNFGASSLDFVLYAYLADIGLGLGVRTELRMRIVERFAAEGIQIPFPQQDIHLRTMPERDVPQAPVAGQEPFSFYGAGRDKNADED
ncbi:MULTISPECIES: mechanosensitive ion channel domain-containing protein [unclassified Roseitalea]|uniref:mechanosensitive ion channel domain-containing protein n=1 Tax=unclassified Roseitalea TaxID=2639107 RepID=UPI00273D458F|nr:MULTISPECIES: mechanosensitive ion channel domain-containing protein [unclassified Roseitalea]